jgi:hypothetical protein
VRLPRACCARQRIARAGGPNLMSEPRVLRATWGHEGKHEVGNMAWETPGLSPHGSRLV